MKYRVHFYDDDSDEFRSFCVDAENEDDAEEEAVKEADRREWPPNFLISEAELIDEDTE
jgi:hypothetical protein